MGRPSSVAPLVLPVPLHVKLSSIIYVGVIIWSRNVYWLTSHNNLQSTQQCHSLHESAWIQRWYTDSPTYRFYFLLTLSLYFTSCAGCAKVFDRRKRRTCGSGALNNRLLITCSLELIVTKLTMYFVMLPSKTLCDSHSSPFILSQET